VTGLPPRVAAALRAPAVLSAAREALARDPSAEVLVVVGAGVEVPELLRATLPAGGCRVGSLPLASALDVARARALDAAVDLALPPAAADAVRVLYLDVHRGCAVASFPARVMGRAGGTDGARGAA
jgi:hypothetical protein